MYCEKCGKEIKDGNNFCTNCGCLIIKSNKRNKLIIIGVSIIILLSVFFLYFNKQYKNEELNQNINISEKTVTEYKIEETKMQQLSYDIKIKENTDMEITETWKIEIKEFNTLFKNFNIDNRYKDITNVKVSEILDNDNKKEFTEIDTEMYHVTKDCFYAMVNSDGLFEIAWGVDTKNEIKTYQISYTVQEAVNVYNDCAEIYWGLIGNGNAIPIDNIEGKIEIENISNISDIKMWGHSEIDAKIYEENDFILFNGKNLKQGNYFEFRLLMPPKIFKTTNIIKENKTEQILKEENIISIDEQQQQQTASQVSYGNKSGMQIKLNGKIVDVSDEVFNILGSIFSKYQTAKDSDIICTNGEECWILDEAGKKVYFDDLTSFENALKQCNKTI